MSGKTLQKYSNAAQIAPFVTNTSKAFVKISEMIRSHDERTSRLEKSMREIKSGHPVTLLVQNDKTGQLMEVTYALVQVSPVEPVYGKILKVSSKARISRCPQSGSNFTLKPPTYKSRVHNKSSRIAQASSIESFQDDRRSTFKPGHRVLLEPSLDDARARCEAARRSADLACLLSRNIARKVEALNHRAKANLNK